MLNRRFLRIKVYHALYAYWQGDDASAARIEKELINSIERTYDIFLGLLLAFAEVRHVAELRMEERRKKRLPTAEDLSPNLRFLENPILRTLANSERLRIECQHRKVSWVGEYELFTRMYREMEASEKFKAYMSDPEPTFRKDQAFILQMFGDHVANHSALQDVHEGRSIHWMEELDLAATMVKRNLEQMRESDAGELSLAELERDPREEHDFVTMLYRKTIEMGDEHEQAIADKASNWESDRIALSDMILMKMALAEVRTFDQIPVKVTLNEYIEIAKAYSTPKSKGFINGVLDKLFMEMKADGRFRKVGRGLLES
jgi:N utilization substance protein B